MPKAKRKNPYVGLRPYTVNESILFFGREDQTWELLQRLYKNYFVAVVGTSGCGKSSLLRAGLIPALKGGFLVEDSNEWLITIMKPGESPMYNLAESLLKGTTGKAGKKDVQEFLKKLNRHGVDAILDLVRPLRKQKNINFFLLVDQFEELFAFAKKKPDNPDEDIADSRNEAINFVNLILELSEQNVIPFYVVLTMRSDFIGDCAEYHGLPEAMNRSQYLVPRLNRQQLKKVIEGPTLLSGKKFNSKLTSKLINNMGDYQDELPILQHALQRMWDFDEGQEAEETNLIDFKDYNGVGGITHALENHAEEVIQPLSNKDKKIARKLFSALTTIDDHNRMKRRPVRLSRLVEITGADKKDLVKVIEHFKAGGRSFLYEENIAEDNDKIIDISHESLIRQWDNLKKLVLKEKSYADKYKKLSEIQSWYDNDGQLLEGSQYDKEIKWYDELKPTKAWAEQYDSNFDNVSSFIQRSTEAKKARDIVARKKKKARNGAKIISAIVLLAAFAFAGIWFGRKSESENIQKEIKSLLGNAESLYANAVAMRKLELEENEDFSYNDKHFGEEGESKSSREMFKELITFIESQKYLYANANEKVVNEHGVFVYEEKDNLLPEADSIRNNSKVYIDSIEYKLDESLWEITLTMVKDGQPFEGYNSYINKTNGLYYNENNAKYLEEAIKKKNSIDEMGLDTDWIEAESAATVSGFLKYIIKTRQNSSNDEDSATKIDRAENKVFQGKRGWLYAGHIISENDTTRMETERNVFKIIYRTDLGSLGNSNITPEIGDYIETRTAADRAVYNIFIDNSVVDKKGAIFMAGDLAYVSDKKILKSRAVFLKIEYGKIN